MLYKYSGSQNQNYRQSWTSKLPQNHWRDIHCLVSSCEVEAIKSTLKFPIYDPFIQHNIISNEGIARSIERNIYTEQRNCFILALIAKKKFNFTVKIFQTLALLHVLSNSKSYARLKNEFFKLHFDKHQSKNFLPNEINCINLLLQGGIDTWILNCKTGELPNPRPMANDEARQWWYYKVIT